MFEKVAEYFLKCRKYNGALILSHSVVFILFYFGKCHFFSNIPQLTIVKTALTKVNNVSFSAHPCEWMRLSQLSDQKAAAADARSCIFGTQLCFVCASGSSYSSASPSLSEFRLCGSALPCVFLLTDSTPSDWKKRGEGNGLLIYFLTNSPNVQ